MRFDAVPPVEAVSGDSGHAERQEDREQLALATSRREVARLQDRNADLARMATDLTAEVARYRAAIGELHVIMDAAIVRGGYRPGESERVESILAAALGDGETNAT